MNVSLGDGCFHAAFAHKVNNRWITNQADRFIHSCFSSFVELLFYFKDNFAFPKRPPEQVTVAGCQDNVLPIPFDVKVAFQVISLRAV